MRAWVVSDEATSQLETWPPRARRLFTELLEDAGSDLQREFLERALVAAHTPAELHAFADELRALDDDAAYDACTLHDSAPEDYTVAQLLRAEADPLFAFELKGGTLEPNERDPAPEPGPGAPVTARPVRELGAENHTPARGRAAASDSFDGLAPLGARSRALDWSQLPSEPPPPPPRRVEAVTGGVRFLEALLAEATRGLQLGWKELDVDVPGGLSMPDAIASAAGALSRGIPVPCVVGPAAGQHRRFVLLLQLSTSGKNRAFQLYDPLSSELLWANEGDLLAKAELPFANKLNRRLTRVVLPQSLRASF